MAREVIIRMTDDFDRSAVADETLEFTFNKVTYVLDLTTEHADELRELLAPWMHAAHEKIKVGKHTEQASPTPKAAAGSAYSDRVLPDDVRDRIRRWAIDNDWPDIAEMKLLSFEVRSAYIDATGDMAPMNPSLQRWRDKQERAAIRQWAKENGYPVGERSNISHEIMNAYRAAHNQQPLSKEPDLTARGTTAKSQAIPDKKLRTEIRRWANDNGYEVSPRGYLPANIVNLFNEAHHTNGVAVS